MGSDLTDERLRKMAGEFPKHYIPLSGERQAQILARALLEAREEIADLAAANAEIVNVCIETGCADGDLIVGHIRRLTRERDEAIRLRLRVAGEEVWYWTGRPSEDEIGSLACPVLVGCDQVRAWVRAEAEVARLRAALETAKAWCPECDEEDCPACEQIDAALSAGEEE